MSDIKNSNLKGLITDYNALGSEMCLAEAAGSDLSEYTSSSRKRPAGHFLINTCFVWAKDDYRSLVEFLSDGNADRMLAAQVVSAMTLSLIVLFDGPKLESLIELYNHYDSVCDEKMAARTLAGIILPLYSSPRRVTDNQALVKLLELWQDSIMTYRRLRETVESSSERATLH